MSAKPPQRPSAGAPKAGGLKPIASPIGPVMETGSGRIQDPYYRTDSPYAVPGSQMPPPPPPFPKVQRHDHSRPPAEQRYPYQQHLKDLDADIQRARDASATFHHGDRPDMRKKELGYSSNLSRWESGVSYAENDYVLPTDDEAALKIRVTEVGSKIRKLYQARPPGEGGGAESGTNYLGIKTAGDWHDGGPPPAASNPAPAMNAVSGKPSQAGTKAGGSGAPPKKLMSAPPGGSKALLPSSVPAASGKPSPAQMASTKSGGQGASSAPAAPTKMYTERGSKGQQKSPQVSWRHSKGSSYGMLSISQPGEPNLLLKIPTSDAGLLGVKEEGGGGIGGMFKALLGSNSLALKATALVVMCCIIVAIKKLK